MSKHKIRCVASHLDVSRVIRVVYPYIHAGLSVVGFFPVV